LSPAGLCGGLISTALLGGLIVMLQSLSICTLSFAYILDCKVVTNQIYSSIYESIYLFGIYVSTSKCNASVVCEGKAKLYNEENGGVESHLPVSQRMRLNVHRDSKATRCREGMGGRCMDLEAGHRCVLQGGLRMQATFFCNVCYHVQLLKFERGNDPRTS